VAIFTHMEIFLPLLAYLLLGLLCMWAVFRATNRPKRK